MQPMSADEFMRWAESLKPCRYCDEKFVGPVCPRCEDGWDYGAPHSTEREKP